jgi:hypothetical protein
MKRIVLYPVILIFSALFFLDCGQKKEESAAKDANELEEWKEMDSFHMVMAEAFHPYKDSVNLAPAKEGAEALAAEAEKWAAAALPAKVDNEEIKAALQQLKADTRAFADQVKASASDEELGVALTNLHDQFHKLMEAWHGGGKHEHGEH